MFGLFDPVYIFVVLIPTLAITGWATWRVKSTYGKWSMDAAPWLDVT